MKKNSLIPTVKFQEAFRKIRWDEQVSKSGQYLIWTDPSNSDIWTRLPIDINSSDYFMYQEKNILILLYALNIPESEYAIQDLKSQLRAYNYKLISRIVGKNNGKSDSVPYELATIVPEKNIEAFRFFYQTKNSKNKSLPIEKFEFNHTEIGSFVIPVSIIVEDDPNTTLIPMQNDTNIALHEYLNAIDKLLKIPRNSALDFADKVIAESIDSKIVKDFFGRDNSIAKYKEKYSNQISSITIGSKGSAFLDFGLKENEKSFKEIDLAQIEILSDEYIEILEARELLVDDTKIEAHDVRIDVIVESIDTSGKAKFTVVGIDGSKIKSAFKAFSTELPKAKLDQFADLFKNSGAAVLSGDIFKSKGKVGKIVVDTLSEHGSNSPDIDLFSGTGIIL